MGAGINVAVLDTGIDLDHADLMENVSGGAHMIKGKDRGGNDDNGHGTHVAGTIAAGRVVVDGNVERVMARLFDIHTPLPAAKPELTKAAAALTPERPKPINQRSARTSTLRK